MRIKSFKEYKIVITNFAITNLAQGNSDDDSNGNSSVLPSQLKRVQLK